MRRKRDEVMAKARAKRSRQLQRKGQKPTADKEQGEGLSTQVKNAVVEVAEKAGDLVKSAAATVTEAITGAQSP